MRKDNPNITFDELHDKVSAYITNKEDLKLITKSYLFAYEKSIDPARCGVCGVCRLGATTRFAGAHGRGL